MNPEPWSGEVEGVLRTDDYEVLRDLMAVVEATQEKNVRLTKSGIPPKPLWSSINSRLLWKDPKSILQDWDEVDQVRFIYGIAEQLHLLQADRERSVSVGPGADRFFLATPSRRAAMIMRGYINNEAWDERCDARNEHGHRLHFGQTFRRDFAIPAQEVRRVVIGAIGDFEADRWYTAESFARAVTNRNPSILISADDDPPEIDDEGSDEEIKRFVDYWLFQAARFGWVDLARTPEESIDEGSERLFQLSDLGRRLLGDGDLLSDDEDDWSDARPFIIRGAGIVTYDRTAGDAGDEYLIRRLSNPDNYPSWDHDVVDYTVTPESLAKAADEGIAFDGIRRRIIERAERDVPTHFVNMVREAFGEEADAAIVRGMTAIEIAKGEKLTAASKKKLKAVGALVGDEFILVPWDRWDEVRRSLGFEPAEGFRYPHRDDPPLARVRKDLVHLEWAMLPLAARDLLVALGVGGDPLQAPLNEPHIKSIGDGWTLRSAAEALKSLSHDKLPAWLAAEV